LINILRIIFFGAIKSQIFPNSKLIWLVRDLEQFN
jgi:hypothetical protein